MIRLHTVLLPEKAKAAESEGSEQSEATAQAESTTSRGMVASLPAEAIPSGTQTGGASEIQLPIELLRYARHQTADALFPSEAAYLQKLRPDDAV